MEKMNNAGLGQIESEPFDAELFEKEYWDSVGNDPEYMISKLETYDFEFPTVNLYPHPIHAKIKINAASEKIRELEEEIAKQNAIILASLRHVKKYKRAKKEIESHLREGRDGLGRPERSEYKEAVVKGFLKKWVVSLMDALQVKGCGSKGGLEKLVTSSKERSWRRWLNGDAIPTYSTFEELLNFKISEGKYAGALLRDVPVTPTHNQIMRFIQLV